ncbi:TonB-dependent receptor domain-containing protein [Peristeroidobacter soli]|uniref:TonB-dependent receptor domain-containing protein n=1 Tax=Peristeroidobacter soli TaxID=2497877 RepID=UPI00101E0CC7|nr:TonB-dependent receptor [Peristeroidobacter soli]
MTIKTGLAIGLLCLGASLHPVPAAADLASRIKFAIEPQELSSALLRYSEQSGVQVTGSADVLEGRSTPGVNGERVARDALDTLLKGTQLNYDVIDANTVAIRGKPVTTSDAGAIQEIVVTGSHIRGATGAAPLLVFSREDIEDSGFSSTQQLIQSLPQNFGGGFSELTMGATVGDEASNYNFGRSSGANLRGIGSDSTLTLLNGRRLAAAGIGDSVDLSMIPLAAIERVDVLTDGASAIYGADAVGGVVNIVLRRDYEGAETRVRYGDVTEGSSAERRLGQTFGTQWNSGGVLATYEYSDRDSLLTKEREITRNASVQEMALVPEMRRHSGLVSLTQSLTDRVQLVADGMYTQRSSDLSYHSGLTLIALPVEVTQYGGTGALLMQLPNDWAAEVAGSYSVSTTSQPTIRNNVRLGLVDMSTTVQALDAKTDGAIFALPGGQVKLAAGVHLRHETFDSTGTSAPTGGARDRDVSAAFAEVLVPFVGEANRHTGLERLELTLAGRYDHYSDFGSTTNPKLGLLWSPAQGLNLRSTYGTSMRAPSLYETSEVSVPVTPYYYVVTDPRSPTGQSPLIMLSGNNSDLRAEKAESWTAGLDFTPRALPGFSATLTYFDLQIDHRIATPVAGSIYDVFLLEERYRDFIERDPDDAVVQSYYDDPRLRISTGQVLQPAANVSAIIHNQLANVARVEQSGLDFELGYALVTALGNFNIRLGGTYLFRKKEQLTEESPLRQGLNELHLPVDLKLRNSIGWSRGNLRATVFVNYVDSYRDTRPGFEAPIDSWTTIDLSTQYVTDRRAGWLSGLRIGVGVQNLTDEAPPFVNYYGYDFDGTNANAIGRYFFVDIAKQFGGSGK